MSGLNFSGVSFNFGIAKIDINSVNTEDQLVSISVRIPVKGGEVAMRVRSYRVWEGDRRVSFDIEYAGNEKFIKNQKQMEEQNQEEDEYEYGDNDGDNA